MNHPLTNEQMLQARAEMSRKVMMRLVSIDAEIAALESKIPVMTIAEFNRQKQAIEDKRAMFLSEWEREKASWTK